MKGVWLLLAWVGSASGQISGMVRDSIDQSWVSFANIRTTDGKSGTSAEANGTFELKSATVGTTVLVSAVGYKSKTVTLSDKPILMQREIYELDEVAVVTRKNTVRYVIGNATKKNASLWYGGFESPWKLARYYPPSEQYKVTPFLEKVTFVTQSDVKDAVFLVHVYEVGEDGKPGKDLVDENIIGHAKSGKRMTDVDLFPFKIKAPAQGFFIGVEWLIIEQNKTMYTTFEEATSKRSKTASYSPFFAAYISDANSSWLFSRNLEWSKREINTHSTEYQKYYDEHLHERNDPKYRHFYQEHEELKGRTREYSFNLTLTN